MSRNNIKWTGFDSWTDFWMKDKENIIETMVRNMQDDLRVGYPYNCKSIVEQKAAIDDYKARYDAQVMKLAEMDEKKSDRWCYMDLRRRGIIE